MVSLLIVLLSPRKGLVIWGLLVFLYCVHHIILLWSMIFCFLHSIIINTKSLREHHLDSYTVLHSCFLVLLQRHILTNLPSTKNPAKYIKPHDKQVLQVLLRAHLNFFRHPHTKNNAKFPFNYIHSTCHSDTA